MRLGTQARSRLAQNGPRRRNEGGLCGDLLGASWDSPGPKRGRQRFKALGPQAHRLPSYVIWGITLLTAVLMAVINFCTIWCLSWVIQRKFSTMQYVVDRSGVLTGIVMLAGIAAVLAALCSGIVRWVAPAAGGSGAPENKGWLNGNPIPGLFTFRNLVCRAICTLLSNMSGYPVGREGPTVTMGSNLAFLLTGSLALPYVRQWVAVDTLGSGCSPALLIDEERFMHAKRIVCTVGGACGMAMLFDSPIGGIIYMFEEITANSWPLEVTFRAFAGTSVCALVSRALLNLCGTDTKAFVVYEWNPQPQPWTWSDVPFFVLVAILMGPFSAFHTRACLAVASLRQKILARCSGCQPCVKMMDAIVYAAIVQVTYGSVALFAECKTLPSDAAEFVRFNCQEGQYNPVASLLLTTSEGAVRRLFSARNVHEIRAENELAGFLAYTALNICLTGIPVPSGNFTGSMLIGGLAGRLVGAVARDYCGYTGLAVSGVYAMVGSAAMLCGFKQMAVAVVVFITGCANDPNLIPPLMLSVTISLALNQLFNERGFDEEQILRKQIPFLMAEPPRAMEKRLAADLRDHLPEQASLPPEATLKQVQEALSQEEVHDFPVLGKGKFCIGFTTRARLEAAVQAMQESPHSGEPALPRKLTIESVEEDDDELLGRAVAEGLGRESSIGGLSMLAVARLAEQSPYTILEDMPALRLYNLFAKAGVRVASVITEAGEFRGMITRAGLIATTQRFEMGVYDDVGDDDDWDEDSEHPEDEENVALVE